MLSTGTDIGDLEWPWYTLNGVMTLILRYSPNAIASQADYIAVVEDRPIMSAEYLLLLLA